MLMPLLLQLLPTKIKNYTTTTTTTQIPKASAYTATLPFQRADVDHKRFSLTKLLFETDATTASANNSNTSSTNNNSNAKRSSIMMLFPIKRKLSKQLSRLSHRLSQRIYAADDEESATSDGNSDAGGQGSRMVVSEGFSSLYYVPKHEVLVLLEFYRLVSQSYCCHYYHFYQCYC